MGARTPLGASGISHWNLPIFVQKFKILQHPLCRFSNGNKKRNVKMKSGKKILLVPIGVLAPVSAHEGPSTQTPIVTGGNFPAHVSAELISPNFPIF